MQNQNVIYTIYTNVMILFQKSIATQEMLVMLVAYLQGERMPALV